MSLAELLLDPDRLALLLLLGLVLVTLAAGTWMSRRRRPAYETAEPVTTWPHLGSSW